jgi:hypothetical protein
MDEHILMNGKKYCLVTDLLKPIEEKIGEKKLDRLHETTTNQTIATWTFLGKWCSSD